MSNSRLYVDQTHMPGWSMVAGLAVRHSGLEFEEFTLDGRDAKDAATIASISPSGTLPLLVAGEVSIWDCYSIIEFLAELAPTIWPSDPWQRAAARSICGEIHHKFSAIQTFLPLDTRSRFETHGRMLTKVQHEINRLAALIDRHSVRDPAKGGFLFGKYCAVDMVLAPLLLSLKQHGVAVDEGTAHYQQILLAHPDIRAWPASETRPPVPKTPTTAPVSITKPAIEPAPVPDDILDNYTESSVETDDAGAAVAEGSLLDSDDAPAADDKAPTPPNQNERLLGRPSIKPIGSGIHRRR